MEKCFHMSDALPLRIRSAVTTSYGLLSRLENWDDHESWNVFFETYWRLIYSLAIRSGLTVAEAEDVVQETVICVAKDLPKFQRDRKRGTFKGWLRNVARWRIADQLRKREATMRKQADERHDENGLALEDIPDSAVPAVELHWEQEWQANLLRAALDRIKRKVKEEHYQIFDLYVIKEWPVEKVAKRLGVSVSQIYVAKHRLTALLKKEIQLLERNPI